MKPCGGISIVNPPFPCFLASNVPEKPQTEKNVTVIYTVENTFLPRIQEETFLIFGNNKLTLRHTPKIRAESSKIIVASYLGVIFICQIQIPEKYDTVALDTPANLTTPVLSTVFEMTRWSINCCGSTMATSL